MLDMAASPCIQCRIDPQLKSRLRAIAVERGLTESALLKRLVVGSIGVVPTTEAKLFAIEPIGPRARVYVRPRSFANAHRSPIASSPSSGAPRGRWARSVGT